MKKLKYAKPALKHIETVVGGEDQLSALAIKSFNFQKAQQLASEAQPAEESKDCGE